MSALRVKELELVPPMEVEAAEMEFTARVSMYALRQKYEGEPRSKILLPLGTRLELTAELMVRVLEVLLPMTVELPPTKRLPPMYWLPVVVAPPETVRPPVCVPLPMVELACEMKPVLKVARPEKFAVPSVSELKAALVAKRLVLLAVVLNKFVVVALPATSDAAYDVVDVELVVFAFVAKLFVVVALVVVELVTFNPLMVARMEVNESKRPLATCAAEAKRLVEVAFVALKFVLKKLVVVALVPVAFTKVRFCSVVEPVSSKFVVVTVPVAVMFPTLVMLPEKSALPCTAN